MYLLIDDVRDFLCDAIARNSKAARELLKLKCWTELGMDNDLGSDSPEEGWQILRWALKEGLAPESVQLVTSNVVAFERMCSDLESHGYVSNAQKRIWKKKDAITNIRLSEGSTTTTQPS